MATTGSLLIIAGPPGSGKSTTARQLAGTFARSVLVEGDAFFAFLAKGAVVPWRREAHEQNTVVTEAAAAAAGRFARGGFTTIFDGMVGPWFLPPFASATGLDKVEYVVLMPSLEQCLRGLRERQHHGFTDEAATRHMHQQFEGAALEDRHVIRDLPESPEAVAALILAKAAEGELAYRP